MMLNAFLTGSHAYGVPEKDSDIDLVVFMDAEEIEKLAAEADEDLRYELNERYTEMGCISLRFGNLNLLCTWNPEIYAAWKKGTLKLKKQKPVSRTFAVTVLSELRQKVWEDKP